MAYSGLGARLYISATAPATYDKAGFEAVGVVYSEAADLLSNGTTLGGTWGTTSDTLMTTGEQVTSKTSKSADSFNVSHFQEVTNDGIVLLKAAYESKEYYSFKLVNGAGAIKYFQAHTTGMTDTTGDTESHERTEYTIQPRSVGAVVG